MSLDQPESKDWTPLDTKGKPRLPTRVFRLREDQATPFARWCHQYYAAVGGYGPGEFPPEWSAPAG
eukprot:11549504-Heterocapsa_arctica.AAC.1